MNRSDYIAGIYARTVQPRQSPMYTHVPQENNSTTAHRVSHQLQLHARAWHEIKILVPIHQHHSVLGSTLLVRNNGN